VNSLCETVRLWLCVGEAISELARRKEMSERYHDVEDLRFLKEIGKLAPTEFDAWRGLQKVVAREGGTIPRK
jgi:hypothetical protein